MVKLFYKNKYTKTQEYLSISLFFWLIVSQFFKFITYWKPIYGIPEYIMLLSYFVSILFYFFLLKNSFKLHIVFHLLYILSFFLLLQINFNLLIPSLSTFLNLFGTMSLGFGFYMILQKQFENIAVSFISFSLLGITTIISLGIIVESNFNFIDTNWYSLFFLNHSDEHWLRLGIKRAQFFFPSPMVAGQYLWFLGSFLLFFANSKKDKSITIYLFFIVGLLAYSSILFTFSRGPIILALLTYIGFLYYLGKNGIKKIKSLMLLTSIVIGLLFFTTQYILNINIHSFVQSFFSLSDDANSGRYHLILEGINKLIFNFRIEGHGLFLLSPFHSTIGIQFENTYLTVVYGLGIVGLVFSLIVIISNISLLFKITNTDLNHFTKYLITISVSWFIYSFVYPVYRESYTAVLSGIIFFGGIYLNISRVNKLEETK
jgi:hypothetical protein